MLFLFLSSSDRGTLADIAIFSTNVSGELADIIDMDEECYRDDFDGNNWQCVNDHTGCIWNDGNNGCSAPGNSSAPLDHEGSLR